MRRAANGDIAVRKMQLIQMPVGDFVVATEHILCTDTHLNLKCPANQVCLTVQQVQNVLFRYRMRIQNDLPPPAQDRRPPFGSPDQNNDDMSPHKPLRC